MSLQERTELCGMLQEAQKQIRQLSLNTSAPKKLDGLVESLTTKLETVQFELKMERSAREDEQSLRLKVQTELAKVRVVLDRQQAEEKVAAIKINDLEKLSESRCEESVVLQATLDCLTQSRDHLEAALSDAHEKLHSLQGMYEEAKQKVEESLEVAEKAVIERESIIEEKLLLLKHVSALEAESQRRASVDVNANSIANALENRCRLAEDQLRDRNREVDLLKINCDDLQSMLEEHKRATLRLEETQEALRDVLQDNEQLDLQLVESYKKQHQQSQALQHLQHRLDSCSCAALQQKLHLIKGRRKREIVQLRKDMEQQLRMNEEWSQQSEQLLNRLQAKTDACKRKVEKLKFRNKQLSGRVSGED